MDLQLLLALVLGIGTIIVLVLRTRLDAFVALLIAALVTGFVAGMPATDTITAITTGFGNTLASIGIVIGLGVGIGKILEVSGAAEALARAFLRLFGAGREPWARASTGAWGVVRTRRWPLAPHQRAPDLGGAALVSDLRLVDIVGLADRRIARFWAAGDIEGLRSHILHDVRPTFLTLNPGLGADDGAQHRSATGRLL
jgi:hypothetical protein